MANAPLDAAALAAIRARCEQATPGSWGPMTDGPKLNREPWEPWRASMEAADGLTIGSTEHTEPVCRVSGYLQPVVGNAKFIAHAREDLPRLLDAYTHQQERIDELERAIRDVQTHCTCLTFNEQHAPGGPNQDVLEAVEPFTDVAQSVSTWRLADAIAEMEATLAEMKAERKR